MKTKRSKLKATISNHQQNLYFRLVYYTVISNSVNYKLIQIRHQANTKELTIRFSTLKYDKKSLLSWGWVLNFQLFKFHSVSPVKSLYS